MPYIESRTVAGRTIEVARYYSSRYKCKGIKRSAKVKPTKEAQEKINTKHAETNLRRLINANFSGGDYHLVLDYIHKKGDEYRTPEQMKKDIAVFLREVRKICKKLGITFKYIHVMEIGEHGSRHHHLIVNKMDIDILQRAWAKAYEGNNRIKVFPLDDSGNYAKLASYLIKYTSKHLKDDDRLQGKRWASSKNLVRPVTKKRIITNRDWYRTEPKAKKGYYVDLDSVEVGITSPEYFGYGYFRYTMVRLE